MTLLRFPSPEPEGELPILPFADAVRLTVLRERLEGRFVARIHWGVGPVPHGAVAVGMELDNGERWAFMALPAPPGSPYRTTILEQCIVPQKIWTKKMTRHFRRGRAQAGEPPADAIQKQVEDTLILGVIPQAPTAQGDKQFILEVRDDNGRTYPVWFTSGRSEHDPNFAALEVRPDRHSLLVRP